MIRELKEEFGNDLINVEQANEIMTSLRMMGLGEWEIDTILNEVYEIED